MELNGLRVSRETQERLQHFAELFTKWAKAINLVAPSTMSDMWSRHIADSAQIFQISPRPQTWIDLGSGGGFPGVITAIFLAECNKAGFTWWRATIKRPRFCEPLCEKPAREARYTLLGSKMRRQQ